jgi:hypothetical protein
MNDAKMPDPTHMHVSLSPESAREIREALTDAVDDLAAAIEFEHNPRMRENYAAIEEAYRRAMTVVTRARAALDVMNNEVAATLRALLAERDALRAVARAAGRAHDLGWLDHYGPTGELIAALDELPPHLRSQSGG